MELRVQDGLLQLNHVLVDTGCSDTIFDTDLISKLGLYVDYVNGMPTAMYGIGGKGEICNQQMVTDLFVDGRVLNQFPLQLGITQDIYGFDGFIGLDFMMETNMIVDFSALGVSYLDL